MVQAEIETALGYLDVACTHKLKKQHAHVHQTLYKISMEEVSHAEALVNEIEKYVTEYTHHYPHVEKDGEMCTHMKTHWEIRKGDFGRDLDKVKNRMYCYSK